MAELGKEEEVLHVDDGGDSEESDGEDDIELELGFLEAVPAAEEEPEWVPHLEPGDEAEWDGGKVGGKPAWLDVTQLPPTSALTCTRCSFVMTFLCQLYAPVSTADVGHGDAYHRCMYMFICQNTVCVAGGSVVALRCQLRKDAVELGARLLPPPPGRRAPCTVCSLPASNRCKACGKATYCCRAHQVLHWKRGHKAVCSAGGDAAGAPLPVPTAVAAKVAFPEFDMEVEPEPTKEERLAGLGVGFLPAAELLEASAADADADEDAAIAKLQQSELPGGDVSDDPMHRAFARRVACRPAQCLRYRLWRDEALLPVSQTPPPPEAGSAPPCPLCGAARRFEFQVLPQVLSYVTTTTTQSLDFGTLAVYSCTASCGGSGGGYHQEHVWVQGGEAGTTASDKK